MSLFDNNLVQKEVPGIEASKAWMENKIIDAWKTYKSTHPEKSPAEFHDMLLNIWLPGDSLSSYDKHISSGDIGSTITYVNKSDKGFHVYVDILLNNHYRDHIDVVLN